MNEVQSYELISANGSDTLNSVVNERLRAGWMLYGSPAVVAGPEIDGSYQVFFSQAMVHLQPQRLQSAEVTGAEEQQTP